jgi:lipopolysaccharide biosynthesis protein
MSQWLAWAPLRSLKNRIPPRLRRRVKHALRREKTAKSSTPSGSPAEFASWVERGTSGRGAPFPVAWTKQTELPIPRPARVGVVVHVFFPELLDEIVRQLSAIPLAFDLIVTNASGSPIAVDRGRLPKASSVVILDVENRGRDLWPLAQVVNGGLLDPYELVLKVHTKRSSWRDRHSQLPGTGASWRDDLLDALLGGGTNVMRILDAFAMSPHLGLVTADGSVLGPEFWGDNQAVTASLLRRLELDLKPGELTFAAGSMYWTRGFILQGLRALGLSAKDFEDESGQVNATTAHALERLIGVVAHEAGLSIVERSAIGPELAENGGWGRFEPNTDRRPRVRVIPFYLPQFHPIPENDRWWGAGFTEWTNVVAAKPVFPGHHQPKLPTTTGFYDLRLRETVMLQASLAEEAGIAGWMYYHYWFAGHQLLETPIQSRLSDTVSLPFCLMWANENWTRRWDGRDDDVLIGQRYDEVSSERFIKDVMPVLRDARYLRIGGRALIGIYRPGQIPNLSAVVASWREAARRGGVGELCVLNVDVAKEFHGIEDDFAGSGLDGTLGFPPHNARWEWLPHRQVGAEPGFAGNILSYRAMVEDSIRKIAAGVPDRFFPGIMVAFDNTARRQRDPDVWFGSNPYTFRRWLGAAAASVAEREIDRRVVFVNAWNEWAEAAVLEPSDRFGSTYLLAVRDVTYG